MAALLFRSCFFVAMFLGAVCFTGHATFPQGWSGLREAGPLCITVFVAFGLASALVRE